MADKVRFEGWTLVLTIMLFVIVLAGLFIGTGLGTRAVEAVTPTSFTYTYAYQQDYGFPAVLSFGNEQFISSELKYDSACGAVRETITLPYPSVDCWYSDVDYNGRRYRMNQGSSFQLNPYLSVTMNGYGEVCYKQFSDGTTCEGTFRFPEDGGVNYVFQFTRKDFFAANISETHRTTYLGVKNVPVTFFNDFAGNQKGGVSVRVVNKLFTTSSEAQNFDMILAKGTHTYNVPVTLDQLGETTVTMIPYIIVEVPRGSAGTDEIRIVSNTPISYTYSVLSSGTQCVANADCPSGYLCVASTCQVKPTPATQLPSASGTLAASGLLSPVTVAGVSYGVSWIALLILALAVIIAVFMVVRYGK